MARAGFKKNFSNDTACLAFFNSAASWPQAVMSAFPNGFSIEIKAALL
jgi:hypothetical protein